MPRLVVLLVALLLTLSAEARTVGAQSFSPDVDAEYFWDGGAVPFLYLPAAIAVGMRLAGEPASSPKLFPASEGFREDFSNTVPEFVVTAYSLGFAGVIALSPRAERWHHLKGFAQAMATTAAVTEITKNVVGRHRPHFQEGMEDESDLRRSFFSGHASFTAAGTVYMGLYLSRNLLPKPSLLKTGSILLLGGLFVGVPYSRVVDHRHHLSDVVTGAAVGSAIATAFYVYQESRFGDEREAYRKKHRNRIQLVPNFRNPGVALLSRW